MSAVRRIHAAILLGAAAVLAPPPTEAARLPDWARAIADEAPPLPDGVPTDPHRVLLSESRAAVQADGSLRLRRRVAVQALSVNTEEVGTGLFPFDANAKITSSRAWHLPPENRAKKSRSTPVDVAVGSAFLSDAKVRALHVAGARKGSLVFFEFEAEETPYFLSLSHLFHEGAPTAVERFELETPPGWSVRTAWLRRPGPDPAVVGNVRTWELRDLAVPEAEPLARPASEKAPLLAVQVMPPEGVAPGPVIFANWASLSSWYESMARGRAEATPAIQAAAKKALASTGSGALDRIRAAAGYVRDRVRYTAVELGIGGYQPRPASDTLANLFGDCKDKGMLFQAFLTAEGLASYPVLVNLGTPDTVPEELPFWGFNHLVVAVPLPADAPPDPVPAVVDAGDLGRFLIVDTTSENTSIGWIPADLAGQRALVVAGAEGRLVTLPPDQPAFHRIERRVGIDVGSDGSMSIRIVSTLLGDFAAASRSSFRHSTAEYRREAEHRLLHLWPEATVAEHQVDPETEEGAFVETLALRRPPAPAGQAKMAIFPGATAEIEKVSLGRRVRAVDYGHPRTIRYEVLAKGLPESTGTPEPQDIRGEGWSVRTSYTRDGEVVTAVWEVVLSRTHFEPGSFPELRKFWSAISSTGAWMLDLPGGPTGGL